MIWTNRAKVCEQFEKVDVEQMEKTFEEMQKADFAYLSECLVHLANAVTQVQARLHSTGVAAYGIQAHLRTCLAEAIAAAGRTQQEF